MNWWNSKLSKKQFLFQRHLFEYSECHPEELATKDLLEYKKILRSKLQVSLLISVGSKITQVIPISVKESRCLHILSAKCPVFLVLFQIDYVKLFMNDH